MLETVVKTGSSGNVKDFLKSVEYAIEQGATDFNCHIQYLNKGSAYVQMIEFTRTLSKKEVLEMERDKILKRLDEINEDI